VRVAMLYYSLYWGIVCTGLPNSNLMARAHDFEIADGAPTGHDNAKLPRARRAAILGSDRVVS